MATKRNAEIISLTQEMEMCIPDTTQERILEGKELGRIMNSYAHVELPEMKPVKDFPMN